METTILYWGYIGIMENQMETYLKYCSCTMYGAKGSLQESQSQNCTPLLMLTDVDEAGAMQRRPLNPKLYSAVVQKLGARTTDTRTDYVIPIYSLKGGLYRIKGLGTYSLTGGLYSVWGPGFRIYRAQGFGAKLLTGVI